MSLGKFVHYIENLDLTNFWKTSPENVLSWRGVTPFYYINTSVLLQNIPLVKFIKTTSGTRLVYFP